MNKHEQLIRKIAEEMAIYKYPHIFQLYSYSSVDEHFNMQEQEGVIISFLIEARIAVKHMAIEFRAGFRCGESYCVKIFNKQSTEGYTKTPLLIERGLIPETKKEVEK